MKKTVPMLCRVESNQKLDKLGYYYKLNIIDFKSARPIFPGQFVHIKTSEGYDPFYRRAFSIAGYNEHNDRLEIIYKIVGKGTTLLSRLRKNDPLDIIGPLGNRFSAPGKNKKMVFVAGGVGLPPLLFFAEMLIEGGYKPDNMIFLYGGRIKDELIELARIERLRLNFIACTDDGSYGYHGFVTDALDEKIKSISQDDIVIYGCGPEPMLNVLQEYAIEKKISGELSLEAPMPCGVGVCLGCVKPRYDNPQKHVRVCHDGPVFKIGEVKI